MFIRYFKCCPTALLCRSHKFGKSSLKLKNLKGCNRKGLQYLAAQWLSVMLTYLTSIFKINLIKIFSKHCLCYRSFIVFCVKYKNNFETAKLAGLPMSFTFFCVSLLNLLKNGFSWVSKILTSSMQTFIILAWMNGYRV